MRFFSKTKDGGKDSTVDAYFLFEIKGFISVALLRFNKGSRNNFHSHAFNALTWFIRGDMREVLLCGQEKKYKRSLLPKITKKECMHKVVAEEVSWCFTVRGKWEDKWQEVDPKTGATITLGNGREVLHIKEV